MDVIAEHTGGAAFRCIYCGYLKATFLLMEAHLLPEAKFPDPFLLHNVSFKFTLLLQKQL
jgi:hypothetical protein